MSERFSLSLQQDLLTLLTHSDEHGKSISKIVLPELFEGDYRTIAEKALSFWQQYDTAPKQHIADLLSDILEDKHDRRSQTYTRILVQMVEVKDQINVEFVLRSMNQFIEVQRSKSVIIEVAELLDARGVNGLGEFKDKLRNFLNENNGTLDVGLHLNEFDKVLDFIGNVQSEFDTGIRELDEAHIVPMRGKLMMFLAPAKGGKCVAEGEHVLLADGRYIPIQNLRDGDYVPSFDEEGRIFFPRKAHLSENGEKEVFEVKTRSGRVVKLTAKHRLLTQGGWKPLCEIDLGELIAVPAECPVFGSEDLSPSLLKIMGYLIADGGLTHSAGYTYTKQDPDVVFDMKECLSEFGSCLKLTKDDPITYYIVNKPELRGKHSFLTKFLREVNMLQKKANQKFVPDVVFTLKKELIAVFLAALFTGDGSIYKAEKNNNKKNTWVFEYSTTSEKLAKQIHHLLMRFGIITILKGHKSIVSGRDYYHWTIITSSQTQLRKLDQEIGLFFSKGELLKEAISRPHNPKTNRTGIDRGRRGAILFDRLVSVSPLGKMKTYDLMVEDTHNFVAENVLVHNTWWLIQLGKRAFMKRKKVLHITLEIEAEEVAQRYYQALFGVSKRDDLNKISTFRYDREGKLDQIVGQSVDVPFTFSSSAIREELQTRISRFGTRMGNIIIKRFPMSSLTLPQLEGYLELLSSVEKYDPDMVILDYPKIMKLNAKELRVSLGNLIEQLRGLSQRRNFALCAVHQGNRGSEDAEFVKVTHLSEDWSIAGTVDFLITFSRTKAEKRLGLARLFVELARSEADKFGVLITQSYKTGQFVLESTRLNDNYAHLMESMDLNGDEDGQNEADD